jgi:glycosyltransferase involved in cell wall biosynthesis
MTTPLVSVVIRTLNEERYLEELLSAIQSQILVNVLCEVVIIDSGSTDRTLEIAREFSCRITHIDKQDFTFGRSLNLGSDFARGDYLVYVSGHCIPASDSWLENLVAPLREGLSGYSYGRQLGRDTTKFSERQLFEKYFPESSDIPQEGFFCNNANSAISRAVWETFKFDENVTGLEDMELAKRYVESGGSVAYVAQAPVFHIHDETWAQTKRRYERESLALRVIMPELRITFIDMCRYIAVALANDASAALKQGAFCKAFVQIIGFRTAQYFGSYRGNRILKFDADRRRESYFYPKEVFRK